MNDLAVLRRLFNAAGISRGRLSLAVLLEVLSVPLTLLTPVPLAIAVDCALGTEPLPRPIALLLPAGVETSDRDVLVVACLLQVVLVVIVQVRGLLATFVQTTIGENATVSLRSRLLSHAQKLSFDFHDKRGSGDAIYRIQYDAATIHDTLFGALLPLVIAVVTLAAMVAVIFSLDVWIAVVALLITPLLFAATRYYRTRIKRRYVRIKEIESSALQIVQEIFSALRVVKSFGREELEQKRFDGRSVQGAKARIGVYLAEGVFDLIVNLMTATGTALVLYLGITRVQNGDLTLGALLLILSYLAQLYGPLQVISRQMGRLQGKITSAERVLALLDETPSIAERPDARKLLRTTGHFQLVDVRFAYPGGDAVLTDVNLDIPSGTRVGIVGRTGAGKSTFLSLLMRFRDPDAGAIRLDGTDLRDAELQSLRAQFAVVMQDPFLFSTSIGENIAYGRPGASFEDVVEAAVAAEIHHVITALPDGYDTLVGERGMRLSGGERQRISLARAFLRDSPILLLDEPTSSVDHETETLIITAMKRLMFGRTAFMVAHRTSTLRDCDLVLRVANGDIRSVRLNVDGAAESQLDADGRTVPRDRSWSPDAANLRHGGTWQTRMDRIVNEVLRAPSPADAPISAGARERT